MYTPEEAIEELEFASKQLGYKVMMVGGLMRRRVPAQKYGRDALVEAVRRGEGLDDYFRCKIGGKSDIRDLFVPRFYFGCEADDPVNAWAFNRRANPMGARLNALFSSDIGHFDVPDMTDVVPEPDFFKGTAVENAAAEALAQPVGAAAAR